MLFMYFKIVDPQRFRSTRQTHWPINTVVTAIPTMDLAAFEFNSEREENVAHGIPIVPHISALCLTISMLFGSEDIALGVLPDNYISLLKMLFRMQHHGT